MYKQSVLLLLLVLLIPRVYATNVVSGKFSFNLPGKWEVTTEKNGALRAQKKTKGYLRVFILSVEYPRSTKEVSKFLLYLRNYLGNLEKDDKGLKKQTEFAQYVSKGGAPFTYVAYSDVTQKGFFVGATLGSNHGVILITYEGNTTYVRAVKELKSIMDTMK